MKAANFKQPSGVITISNMNFHMYILLVLLPFLGLLAQSEEEERDKKNETVRDFYHYRIGDVSEVDAFISFGMGEMTIAANSHSKRFDGSMQYNPHLFEPEITYEEKFGKGTLSIRQATDNIIVFDKDFRLGYSDDRGFSNIGEFLFPPDIGLNANINFGLGKANLNFSGLTINNLEINCGLGEMEISIELANNTIAEFLSIDAGLGKFEGRNLGNFRAKNVSIKVGMGSAEIDMRGHNLIDTYIDIAVGLGALELILPEKSNIKISADHNFLSSVDVYDLVKKNDQWKSEDWDESYPTFIVDAKVGIGSIEIKVRD